VPYNDGLNSIGRTINRPHRLERLCLLTARKRGTCHGSVRIPGTTCAPCAIHHSHCPPITRWPRPGPECPWDRGFRDSVVNDQTPCSSFCIGCVPTVSSRTLTSWAFGARSRNVTRLSECTSGEASDCENPGAATANIRMAGRFLMMNPPAIEIHGIVEARSSRPRWNVHGQNQDFERLAPPDPPHREFKRLHA